MALSLKMPKIAAVASATIATVDPVMPIAISDISLDSRLQKRVEIYNEAHVRNDLLSKLNEGIELDPVEVVREVAEDGSIKLWLWHGRNRLQAHIEADRTIIMAKVRNGTFRDARRLALTPNNDHGLKLTDQDKQRTFDLAVEEYREEIESGTCGINELARRTNLSPAYVSGRMAALKETGQVQKAATTTAVRNGKPMNMRTANITGRKPNATVDELKAWLSDWVIDNYPAAISDALTSLVLGNDRGNTLYGQMEGIPQPHRRQDLVEAARLLLNDEKSSECTGTVVDESADELPASTPSAPAASSTPTPKPKPKRQSTLVCGAEPTLHIVFTHSQALRLLKLCLDSGDSELITAVQMELDKVAC